MKIVTYTVVTNNYDKLQRPQWPAICLTNCDMEPMKGWSYMRIVPAVKGLRRASRHPKMLPQDYFPNADYSIYMDGNIKMLRSPERIVDELLGEHDMALYKHPQRICAYREARECLKRQKGDPILIEAQMKAYKKEGLPPNNGLAACWVIVRRHVGAVNDFGNAWWVEFLKRSRRDQLSFAYVQWKLGMKYQGIPGNLFKNTSEYFRRFEHVAYSRRKGSPNKRTRVPSKRDRKSREKR